MITIRKVECDRCGRLVTHFYSKDKVLLNWWDKYLDDNEEVCIDCIKNRKGFRKEFRNLLGMEVNEYLREVK